VSADVESLISESFAYFEADVGPIRPEVAAALPCFAWDLEKLRGFPAPVESLEVASLSYFLDAPIWRRAGDRPFTLAPAEVAAHPAAHQEHFAQAMETDLSFPIEMIFSREAWRLADGYHRLLKATMLGEAAILARLLPEEAVPLVLADLSALPAPRGGARFA
jgi:hypothetical protein